MEASPNEFIDNLVTARFGSTSVIATPAVVEVEVEVDATWQNAATAPGRAKAVLPAGDQPPPAGSTRICWGCHGAWQSHCRMKGGTCART
ncbi:hypothetical protein D3C80_1878860 [compost metagenome]